MTNDTDKMTLSACMEGLAGKSCISLGNLQPKRSCCYLMQHDIKDSKADTSFTSGCNQRDNSRMVCAQEPDILPNTLFLLHSSLERKKKATKRPQTNSSGLHWHCLQRASHKLAWYSALFSMPFIALGRKRRNTGQVLHGWWGKGLSMTAIRVKQHKRLMGTYHPMWEAPKLGSAE